MNPSKASPRAMVGTSSGKDVFSASSSTPSQDAGAARGGGGSNSGGGGVGVSSAAAVAHRAALTREEQWETLVEMAQCTARLSPEDAAQVQVGHRLMPGGGGGESRFA